MIRKVIPGANYGEYWPDGSGRDSTDLPIGYPDDLALFTRVSPDGRVAAKAHSSLRIWYWVDGGWKSLGNEVTPNSPVAFHPSSGEVYVAFADRVQVFDRAGHPTRSLPGYTGSQGIRQVNADGSIQTGDSTYGDGILSEYTALAAFKIGQGHDGGGIAIEVNGTKRTILQGGQTFVRANQVGDQIAAYGYDGRAGYLLIGSVAEFLAVPVDRGAPFVPAPVPAPTPNPTPTPTPNPTPVVPVTPTPFDPSSVQFVDSPADVASWRQSAAITQVDFSTGRFVVDFSGRDSWPDLPFGDGSGGTVQYTLGMCCFVGGKWVGSGVVQFWKGRALSEGGSVATIAQDWFYDGRWGALQGHQPQPGELVYVFVEAGNCRGNQNPPTGANRQRSDFAAVTWGQPYSASAAPVDPPVDPVPVNTPAPPAFDPSGLLAQLAALSARVAALEAKPAPIAPDLGAYAKPGDHVTVTSSKLPWIGVVTLHGTIDAK